MSQEKKNEAGQVSRREFIRDAGLMVGGAAIASTPLLSASPAQAAGTVTLEVLDPSGAYEVKTLFASRVPDLNGKTLCEVSDGIWQSWRTFPLIRELLKKQFPTIKIIPYTEAPTTGSSGTYDAEVGNKLKKMGCDVAIVGNAG